MTIIDQEQGNFILTASCRAGTGVVAGVTTFLADRNCYICALEQFDDESTDKFFMRAVFRLQEGSPEIDEIRRTFPLVASRFDMSWAIFDPNIPTKVMILVSKFDHCLGDLLYRQRIGDLNMEIVAVVSNHTDLQPMVERDGVRFIHLPVTKDNKPLQEAKLLDLVSETGAELVVLARYMQI